MPVFVKSAVLSHVSKNGGAPPLCFYKLAEFPYIQNNPFMYIIIKKSEKKMR